MKEILEAVLDCIEAQRYVTAFRTLRSAIEENQDFIDRLSLDDRTAIDVLYSCLHIVMAGTGTGSDAMKNYPQRAGVCERMAFLLTKKLLGDRSAGKEVETLMFCNEAINKLRYN